MIRFETFIKIIVGIILLAGAAVGFLKFRSKMPAADEKETSFIEDHRLLEAVPSDAAIVFCVKDFQRACDYLSDTLAVFRELTSCLFDSLALKPSRDLGGCPTVMSVHYSRDIPPLLVVDAGKARKDSASGYSALVSRAASAGLKAASDSNLVFISPSETIVGSSMRHLAEGHSVLEAKDFSQIARTVKGDDAIFASSAYSDNIFNAFLDKHLHRHAGFFRELCSWYAFSITNHEPSNVSLHGKLLYGSDQAYYLNVLRKSGTSGVSVPEALPAGTDYVFSIPVKDISDYIKAYRDYLDSKVRLDRYEQELSSQRARCGKDAEQWAEDLGIKEVAMAGIHFSGELRNVLLVKPGRKPKPEEAREFSQAGFVRTLFGSLFGIGDESFCTTAADWLVIGPRECMEEYSSDGFLEETLKARLAGNGLAGRIPQKYCGFWMYHSLTEDPTVIDRTFSPEMATGVRRMVRSVNFAPVTVAAIAAGDKMDFEINVDRINVAAGKVQTVDRDTSIVIPEGPFKVRNSATGAINTLYQNKHRSICLQDENGKDLWGIPFKHRFCGYVKEIDYFGNGKLQYLFCADSSLYAIDRLGRFVSGFPKNLGDKVILGPELVEYSGATVVMALMNDNTVRLWSIDGEPVRDWGGITSSQTIKNLPEPLQGGGKKFWTVRTSKQTLVYPYKGGKVLLKGEGGKMIRPDSKLEINQKGQVVATCYDGKERTFKFPKKKKEE